MFEDSNFSINPVQFFALSCDCFYLEPGQKIIDKKTHLLPSTAHLTHDSNHAKVSMGWNEHGLTFFIKQSIASVKCLYPHIENGDSVELFIDTRDLKSAGFNTRFCHHFFFLPQPVEGHSKGEITHFRTEDRHDLCDPDKLFCDVSLKKDGYLMTIFIPASCLNGYDPQQFDRLGFTYRINLAHDTSQHFSTVSQNYQIDQQPSLWASLQLVREI